ncbi:transcriptional regulator [bacterium]|nr:MAG: transcriptional regulator [bacterium]
MTTDEAPRAITEAQEAQYRCEYGRCLQLLESIPIGPTEAFAQALLLRGRVLLARNPQRAVRTLTAQQFLLVTFPEAHLEASILLARAHLFTGDLDTAERLLRASLERARVLDHRRLQAYTYLNLSTFHWLKHQFNDAEDLAQRSLIDPEPLAQARAHTMASWVRAGREDFAGQLHLARQALSEAQASRTRDIALEASLTHVLAAVGTNLCDQNAVTLAWQTAETLPWTDDLSDKKFQTYRALGTAAALVGDWFNMERFLRLSIRLAPSPSWEAFARLELSRLLRAYNNRSWTVELEIADNIARDVEWPSIHGEEQEALLLFVELFANHNWMKAAHYLEALRNAGPMDARVGSRSDSRQEAKILFAQAMLRKANGDAYLARRWFQRSWEIFDRIGYAWRAATAALEALDVCDAGELYKWLTRANSILAIAPKSWFAEQLGKRSKAPITATVHLNAGPARVLRLLLRGKTPKEVCEALRLSRHTVNKHIATIKRGYGVTSTNQLLALFSGGSDAQLAPSTSAPPTRMMEPREAPPEQLLPLDRRAVASAAT